MRKHSLLPLFALAICLLPAATGCQRWTARLDSLRDERVGEIERNLGMCEDDRSASREQAMPEFPDTPPH